MKPDKRARILHGLAEVVEKEIVLSDVIESVTGKLVDIRLLVPGGKVAVSEEEEAGAEG